MKTLKVINQVGHLENQKEIMVRPVTIMKFG